MAVPPFTLHVSADPDYRRIACEVVSRYLDVLGGSDADREAFSAALSERVGDLVGDAATDVEFSCVPVGTGCEVTLRCNGRSSLVRHNLAAPR